MGACGAARMRQGRDCKHLRKRFVDVPKYRPLKRSWLERQAPGATEGGSTVISFAQKTFSGGVLTSKLHVIELGAQPGEARSAGGGCLRTGAVGPEHVSRPQTAKGLCALLNHRGGVCGQHAR